MWRNLEFKGTWPLLSHQLPVRYVNICIKLHQFLAFSNKKYKYIYIWLVVLNTLKNMKVNGKDDNPYISIYYGKMKNVPNHQSDIYILIYIYSK